MLDPDPQKHIKKLVDQIIHRFKRDEILKENIS